MATHGNDKIILKDGDDNDDVKVTKASFTLKKKAGSGGFDPRALALAEKRLADAKKMFPTIAAGDIEAITYALKQLEHATQTKEWIDRIQWAAAELKINSAMFQYPLVTEVTSSLYEFLAKMKTLTPLGREVIALHLQTLMLAMEQGARPVTQDDKTNLLYGLGKAVEKALAA